MRPDYDLTIQPTSDRILRAHSTRAMKKREAMTREEATFHMAFPSLTDCKIFVPQQQTDAEYNDISRETTTAPAQCKAKVAAGEWFIYAEPKAAYDADNSVYELRVKTPHANNPAAPISKFNIDCSPLATFLPPCNTLSEGLLSKSYFTFPKSNFTIQSETPTIARIKKPARFRKKTAGGTRKKKTRADKSMPDASPTRAGFSY